MAITRGIRIKASTLVIALVFFLNDAEGSRGLAALGDDATVFDVTKFGAKGDGKPVYDANGESMNGLSFIKAWQKACHSKGGASKVVIPKGTFAVAQVVFGGPCESQVTVELQGNIIPDPDQSQYPNNQLFLFQGVNGVTFTGPGTIDVRRLQPQKPLVPVASVDFFSLMPSITFLNATNCVVDGITSMNPSAFHMLVAESSNINIKNVRFDAASVAPNSNCNGVYISSSSLVTVSNSFIRTGDDCVTIAPGSTHVSVNGLTCVAGQGISIGAQAYTDALDVKGVTVKNCTFKGTAFAARIAPLSQPKPCQVSNVIFQDLVMEGVQNPIFIQSGIEPKIMDVQFRNISGSRTSNGGVVSISCNPVSPCQGIQVSDINLSTVENVLPGKDLGVLANCLNAQVLFSGKHDGLSCGLLH